MKRLVGSVDNGTAALEIGRGGCRGGTIRIASWNVNSIRARLGHVTRWLGAHEPDVLLLQELKGEEFPAEVFRELGYESVAVTQKAYNGVAILSRLPIETVGTTLAGDEADSHARYLEVRIGDVGIGDAAPEGVAAEGVATSWIAGGGTAGLRIVNIYLPNGNPVGTDKFLYKLGWMDRLIEQMARWKREGTPVLVGGDFNVIPEDIDCHKPASWAHDALFQPEPRARYRALLEMGYTDAFRSLHPGEIGQFTFWDYFRMAFEHNRGIRIDHFLLSPGLAGRLVSCEIDRGPRGEPKPSDHAPITVELR